MGKFLLAERDGRAHEGVAESRDRQRSRPHDPVRRIEAYLDAGVTHFIPTLTRYDFAVLERFSAEVMPAFQLHAAASP